MIIPSTKLSKTGKAIVLSLSIFYVTYVLKFLLNLFQINYTLWVKNI